MKHSAGLFLVCVAAFACTGSDTTEPPPVAAADSILIDASQSLAFVRLGAPAQVVAVVDPASTSAWDMGFFSTNVILNGGAAGPGQVSGFCVCARAGATDDAVRAMTPASMLPDFTGLTTSSIPSDSSFRRDQLTPAIAGWYSGSGSAAAVVSGRSWIIREGTTAATLAKFRVTGLQQASATSAGQISFEFAVQPAPGTAFGAVQSRTVDVRSGAVYFDLTTGSVTSSANWDLRFDGFDIRTNGGVSGSGSVGAIVEATRPFANIDAAYAATAPPQAYRRDAFGGVFAQQPWYRYNITGTDNQIWPTFNVYVIKRGAEVFKVQLTGYYGPSGEPRKITMRYARLR